MISLLSGALWTLQGETNAKVVGEIPLELLFLASFVLLVVDWIGLSQD